MTSDPERKEANPMDKDVGAMTGKAAVGDALGVPYEFRDRGSFEYEGMVGHGTHDQPAGTWSDDTALMLATCGGIRDVGNATAEALRTGRGLISKDGARML